MSGFSRYKLHFFTSRILIDSSRKSKDAAAVSRVRKGKMILLRFLCIVCLKFSSVFILE